MCGAARYGTCGRPPEDRKSTFTYYNYRHPINFTSPGELQSTDGTCIPFPQWFSGAHGSADIKVDDSKLYQQMVSDIFSRHYVFSRGFA